MEKVEARSRIRNKGYLLLEMLICIFIFSVAMSVIAVFLKRTVIIEKSKDRTQKKDESLYLLLDRIVEDIVSRERDKFYFEGENEDFHVGSGMLLFKKGGAISKLEYSDGKLYISEGADISNMGGRTYIGAYDMLEFKKIERLLVILMEYGGEKEVKVISLS